jgi:hypothetical protein
MAYCCGLLAWVLAPAGAAEESVRDLLAAPGITAFQPVGDWHRVRRAVAVPDRMEITTVGQGDILVNGTTKDLSVPYLFSRESFRDVRVEMDFLIPQGSNAGVYLMGRYEVQILDSHGKKRVGSGDLGGIYACYEPSLPKGEQWSGGTAPLANAAKPPGRWQTMEIVFRAPRFDENRQKIADARFESVKINGTLVQEDVAVPAPTASHPLPGEAPAGPLVIQGDHGPIAIRKLTVTPLIEDGDPSVVELDAYWAKVSKAVKTGDFALYRDTVHEKGVLVSGRQQNSYPLHQALTRWEKDFERTKSGLVDSEVVFRFAHRYWDGETAHEEGIFRYTARPRGGEPTVEYIDFEALLVREGGEWKMMMEYQKAATDERAWDRLAP